jgi:serine/threonine-protein kinase
VSSFALMPGSRLDRYEVLAPIAEGGMGQVWLARLRGKRGFEKLVAIKVPKLSSEMDVQQMLFDEARIASAIEHVNVAQIVDLGEQGDLLYIVMEWVDGDSLSTLLRVLDKAQTPLALPIALRIISETCAGAHAAHELKGPDGTTLEVVHRDISPQNTLITRGGSVKLIDFGIAKARSRATGDTSDGTLKGKVKYMAPEQALGRRVDRRADIFSLGAMLYRLLGGRPPYEGENEVATLNLLLSGNSPPPLPANVPPQVAKLVYRALAFSPEARFQTAAEMQQAIGKAMTDCHLSAEPTDVAAFVSKHLRERQAQRARAIELALKAAADRATAASLLQPPPVSTLDVAGDSSSGASSSFTLATAGVQVSGTGATFSDGSLQSEVAVRAVFGRSRAFERALMVAIAMGAVGLFLMGSVYLSGPRQRPAIPTTERPATQQDVAAPMELTAAVDSVTPPLAPVAPVPPAAPVAPVATVAPAAHVAHVAQQPTASATARVTRTVSAPAPAPAPVVRTSKPAATKPAAPDFGY